jgi:predicted transcriptional regulator
MTKVLSLRVPDDLAEWADSYAESRGVTRQALCEQALVAFKEDCEAGVPEIRARARAQSTISRPPEQGVGDCPKREGELGHIWANPRVDPRRRCVHCGTPGRGDDQKNEGGHLKDATLSRTEFFSTLKVPMQSGTGDPKKAWPEGMPPAMAARAAEIRADKSRRDREKNGKGPS